MEKAKALLRGQHANEEPSSAAEKGAPKRNRFNLDSLRGQAEPDLAKNLFGLIKSEGHIIENYEAAGRERSAFASQLSSWGESTQDDAVSEIADQLAVIFHDVAEVEDEFARQLEESRATLKSIRNTERNVGPVRDNKNKIKDKLEKLRHEDPNSDKISGLEQELSRAEAESLVAEVQLTNITRHKFKVAYDVHLAAMLERADKQSILANHARRLIRLLDDTPIKPGDARQPFTQAEQARHVLSEARQELQSWTPSQQEKIDNQEHLIGDNALSKEDATDEEIARAVRGHVQQDQPPATVATTSIPVRE